MITNNQPSVHGGSIDDNRVCQWRACSHSCSQKSFGVVQTCTILARHVLESTATTGIAIDCTKRAGCGAEPSHTIPASGYPAVQQQGQRSLYLARRAGAVVEITLADVSATSASGPGEAKERA
jgi:hypothetical protein